MVQLPGVSILWVKGPCADHQPKNERVHIWFLYISEKERLNLTSIKLTVNGAQAWATVNGPLTSGMVGLPVTIEYDEAWDGLTKNLVCRCSPWNCDTGEIRTILDVGDTAVVAHEVMLPDMYLHLGVEGFSSDGALVIPTTWAKCGKIEYGANTCKDLSTDPELSVWNQLQTEMAQIRQDVVTAELVDEIKGYAQSALQAASDAERAAERAEAAADSGGYAVGLPASAKTVLGNIVTILKAQVEDERGTPQGYSINVSGLFAQCDALISALGGSGEPSGDAPEKILIRISAAYSGGPVPAGTALEELVGVAVTAHYGDGSSADVTDYTLSGVIAEGNNTIVVTYGGMTATFQVVGTGSTVYLADVTQFDQFVIRKNLTQNNEAGAWSVEVPYTEGMTVSGCMNPGWNYSIAIITAPDGTQSLSATDTAGAKLSEVLASGYVTQYTAVLTGYAEGSTVRINMYMGKDITTEELARGFATTHRDYLYYEPGEV